MTTLEKAQKQLEGCDITTRITNGTLYICIDSMELELAEFEINYRAELYDKQLAEQEDEEEEE